MPKVWIGAGLLLAAAIVVTSCGEVTITSVPVKEISVLPGQVTLSIGEETPLRAVATDDTGEPLHDRVFEWVVEDEGVASVGSDGLVRAVRPGATTVKARSDGVVGEALVRVQSDQERGDGGDEGKDEGKRKDGEKGKGGHDDDDDDGDDGDDDDD